MSNKRFETIIREAEEAQRPKIEQDQQDYATAAGILPSVIREYDETRLLAPTIRGYWAAMLDTYTADDYARAQASELRAKERARGALGRFKTAERKRRGLRTNLAEVAARVIGRAMPGVPVLSTFATIPTKPREADLPVAVVTQTKLPELSPEGVEYGEVNVTYYFSKIHVGLASKRMIEQAAEELGLSVTCVDERRSVGGNSDSARLEVTAHPDLPYYDVVLDAHSKRLGHAIAEDIAAADVVNGQVYGDLRSGLLRSSLMTVLPDELLTSETVDDDGKRTVTIEASILLDTLRHPDPGSIRNTASDVTARLVGAVIPDLGRVECVELLSTEGHRLEVADGQVMSRIAAAEGRANFPPARRETGDIESRRGGIQLIIRGEVVSSAVEHEADARAKDELALNVADLTELVRGVEREFARETQLLAMNPGDWEPVREDWREHDYARGLR
ncbi:hypothetical protein [Nocardioides soli]|uniref:Uncharacterized protein n=1 Tax=Nocardioides soli TaxID=1036020 RepID=A0A7W4Z3E9_9ACTN|nr:hypothetical protein [Nocardioides soli]MBB3044897.1 hypothetical protein [Nocardioides soli]